MFASTQIAALLHNEHIHTIQALQRLEGFLMNQTAKKVPDVSSPDVAGLLSDTIGAVAAEVERHFGFEENHLFPVLIEQGEEGIALFLTEEHATILPLAQELAAEVDDAKAQGFSAAAWKEFHAKALELCEREIFHIQKEEMGLLAAISMYVDSDCDAQLAELYNKLIAHA